MVENSDRLAAAGQVKQPSADLSVSSLWLEKDDTEVLRRLATPRMALSAFVGKVLEEPDLDVLAEASRFCRRR